MTVYTIYEKETGEIISTVQSNEEPDPRNGSFIFGEYDPNTYHIRDGVPTKKAEEEIERKSVERAWVTLRRMRNEILESTDWTQVPDAPVDRAAWAAYRQELRDLPENTTDPRNVVWPKPPSTS